MKPWATKSAVMKNLLIVCGLMLAASAFAELRLASLFSDGMVTLPPIPQTILSSSVLTGGKVEVQQDTDGISICVPLVDRRLLDTVVVLELDKSVTDILKPWNCLQ